MKTTIATNKFTILLGTLAFGIAFVLFGAGSADAHNDRFSSSLWPSDPTMYRGSLSGTLNTGAGRQAMYRGDNAWDNVYGSTLDFIDSSYQNIGVNWWGSACSLPAGVWFLEQPLSGFGASSSCVSGGVRSRSGVRFDSTGRNWYTGTGTPGFGQSDLWGVATHELGHAGGWRGGTGHYSGSSLCPGNSTKHTMCSGWTNTQLKWARDLRTHDSHAIAGAY